MKASDRFIRAFFRARNRFLIQSSGRLLLAGLLTWLLPGFAEAQLQVTEVFPALLPAKAPVQIRFTGKDLPEKPELWTSFTIDTALLEANPEFAVFELRPPATATQDEQRNGGSPGIEVFNTQEPVYGLIRLVDVSGVSDPFLVCFHPQGEFLVEVGSEHRRPEASLSVSPSSILTGTLNATQSVWFQQHLDRGATLSMETFAHRLGSPLDPLLRVWDTAGREWLSVDDTPGTFADALLNWTIPRTGLYRVELRDSSHAGGPNHRYYLHVTESGPTATATPTYLWDIPHELPCARNTAGAHSEGTLPVEPDLGAAQEGAPVLNLTPDHLWAPGSSETESSFALDIPNRLHGCFDGELAQGPHRLLLNTHNGLHLRIRARTRSIGSALDVSLRLTGIQGRLIRESNATQSDDGLLEYMFKEEGLAVLEVIPLDADTGPAFFYELEMEPARPWFEMELDQHTLHVSGESPGTVELTVARKGYDGPIHLDWQHLPEGIEAEPAIVPEKATQLKIVLKRTAPEADPSQIAIIRLEGRTADAEQPWKTTAHNLGALRKRWPQVLHPVPVMNGRIFLHTR